MGDDPNRQGSSRRWIMRAVEDSLRRLDTDWIDLYQVHRPRTDTDIDETLGALTDLVHQGKIRYIGASTFPPSRSSKPNGSPASAVSNASSPNSPPTPCWCGDLPAPRHGRPLPPSHHHRDHRTPDHDGTVSRARSHPPVSRWKQTCWTESKRSSHPAPVNPVDNSSTTLRSPPRRDAATPSQAVAPPTHVVRPPDREKADKVVRTRGAELHTLLLGAADLQVFLTEPAQVASEVVPEPASCGNHGPLQRQPANGRVQRQPGGAARRDPVPPGLPALPAGVGHRPRRQEPRHAHRPAVARHSQRARENRLRRSLSLPLPLGTTRPVRCRRASPARAVRRPGRRHTPAGRPSSQGRHAAAAARGVAAHPDRHRPGDGHLDGSAELHGRRRLRPPPPPVQSTNRALFDIAADSIRRVTAHDVQSGRRFDGLPGAAG